MHLVYAAGAFIWLEVHSFWPPTLQTTNLPHPAVAAAANTLGKVKRVSSNIVSNATNINNNSVATQPAGIETSSQRPKANATSNLTRH